MKYLILCFMLSVLSGCAINQEYEFNPDNLPSNKLTVINIENEIKLSRIDDIKFNQGFNPFWGNHKITLPAGVHTFEFKYRTSNGSLFTTIPTVLTKNLKSGNEYKIIYKFTGGGISFSIIKIENEI